MNGILISTSAVVIILAVIVILSLLVLYQFYSTRVLTQKIVNVLEKGKDSPDSVEVAIVNDIIITIKSMEIEVLRIYMPGEYRDGIYKGCENAIKAIKMIVPRRVQ